MGKRDSKHKKKTSHKKKYKNEKKKHKGKKSKHSRRSSSSSDSDASTDSCNYGDDKPRKREETKGFRGKISDGTQDEMDWDDLFSERYSKSREKREPRKEGHILEKPGQSSRELNPYWQNGGNGLPPTQKETLKSEKEHDINSLKKLLQKARDTAHATGIPLAEVVNEEWGPLEKLYQIIEDLDNESLKDASRGNKPCSDSSEMRNKCGQSKSFGQRFNFIKPGEGSTPDFINTYKRNWRKKEEKECGLNKEVFDQNEQNKKSKEVEDTVSVERKRVPTADELNALAAKKIKAEIMGNKALAEKLQAEIDLAKKERHSRLGDGRNKLESEKEEVVIVRKSELEKVGKARERDYDAPECSRKKRRGETHKENERFRYFMDDDKHSLKSMFEREKLGTVDQSEEILWKIARKSKFRSSNDENDLDDDFVDRVRCSDYERNENDKEKNRIKNEARAKHISLNHCRWCLDGNNVQKHLIISVGSKCYLCLPSEKSLTNGHCLIVPVHHDTCGTLVDEDVWNEIQSYRNRLCRMFEDSGQDIVFFENARSLNRFPHMVLHCVPMDKEVGDLAPIYFKKAIMESETEWSNNKKLIDLRNKDLRKSIPKGLPYFAVDFGRDGGFAHVIEDEKLFPPNFAEEIIGGMLDMDAVNWRKRRKESLEGQKEKVKEFLKRWEKYGDEGPRKRCEPESDSSDSDR